MLDKDADASAYCKGGWPKEVLHGVIRLLTEFAACGQFGLTGASTLAADAGLVAEHLLDRRRDVRLAGAGDMATCGQLSGDLAIGQTAGM